MRSFTAATHIAAPPQHVWDVQLGLADWADWDPNIARAEGNLAKGGAITLYTRRPGEHKIRKFDLNVVEWQPPTRLVLVGGMPLGLFSGIQSHVITADGSGSGFVITEAFTGLFARLFRIPDLQPGFSAYADGLRQAAEASAP
jgi:uncharacterized protein YndB with AHSA1/START domain